MNSSGDEGMGSLGCLVDLTATDTVELWVRRTVGTGNPTIRNVVLRIMEIGQISQVSGVQLPVEFSMAASDETTALTTGTDKTAKRVPFAMTLSSVRAEVNTAPTGSTIIVDINKNGASILSTKLTIDATETTSVTAAIAPVLSDTTIADNDRITIDIDAYLTTFNGRCHPVWYIFLDSIIVPTGT